jgi:YegS/Rv2252/BmrU family lipid kinase
MKRYLFVVNPISGGRDKEVFLEELERLCRTQNMVYEVLKTRGDNDEERIEASIVSFQPNAVVACGGDGTINLVGRCLIGHPELSLGIIPMGSANGLATELHIPEKLEDALNVLCQGNTLMLDAVQINEQYYCLHLSDLGFNANIVEQFEKSNLRGQLAYLLFFVKSLFTDHVRRYYFRFPEQGIQCTAAMVVLANGRLYGMGAEVNPKGRPGDGYFEVCIFRQYPWYAFFGILFRFLTGRLRASRYYELIRTQSVLISVHRPVELQVDGEALGSYQDVSAKVIPQALRVLCPA